MSLSQLPPPPAACPPAWRAELRILHCNDLFSLGSPLSVFASLPRLRSLALEGLQCRLYREPVALLGRLTEVSAALPRPLPCPVRSQSSRRGRWLWCGGGLGASPLARGAIAG